MITDDFKLSNKPTLFVSSSKPLFESDIVQYTNSIDKVKEYLEKTSIFGLDTETNGLSPFNNKILLISLGDRDNKIVLDATTIDCSFLKPYLEDKTKLKVLQNVKFDYKMFLSNYGIVMENVWDTMLAEEVLFSGYDIAFDLGTIAKRWLNYSLDKSVRLEFVNKKPKHVQFSEKQIEYAAIDASILPDIMYRQIAGYDNGNTKRIGLYDYQLLEVAGLESQVSLAYADMEYNGLKIDASYWKKNVIDHYTDIFNKVKNDLDQLGLKTAKANDLDNYVIKHQARSLFDGEIISHWQPGKNNKFKPTVVNVNWNSNKSKLQFFKDIGYDMTYKNKQGQIKEGVNDYIYKKYCDSAIIEKLNAWDIEGAYEKAKSIFDLAATYAKLAKLLNTYGVNFITKWTESKTGRIHTSIFQLGADTGRVSSRNPNLQNIPSNKKFRQGFVSRSPEHWIITADYSGAELRIIAEGSQEEKMIKAFNDNLDLHSYFASVAYGVEVSKTKNKHLRQGMKEVNFGLAYGAGPSKFAEKFGGFDKANDFINNTYFANFPQLKTFFEGRKNFAIDYGYSVTLPPYNRRRWYPDQALYKLIIDEPDSYTEAEVWSAKKKLAAIGRQGMNQPIQGTNADMIKLATLKLRNWIHSGNNPDVNRETVKIINQVHDEIVIEVKGKELAKTVAEQTHNLMMEAGSYIVKSVKMTVDYDILKSWTK